MPMIVDAISLPDEMEQGAEFGLQFSSTSLPAANGLETINQNWVQGKHQGSFSFGIMDKADALTIKTHHAGRRGIARGWLLKNFTDYEMARMQIGTGNGVLTQFGLFKTYADSINPYLHVITRPVTGTLQVWVNNILKASPADYSFAVATGITFTSAVGNGLVIEASCEFTLPVRYTSDYLGMKVIHEEAISVPDFGVIEITEYLQS